MLLALGTGNQYPKHEFSIGPEYLRAAGCRQGGRELKLAAAAASSTALVLRVQAAEAKPLSCWAELTAFEVELVPAVIPVYLDEVGASPALRATWAAMAARGLPWKERYIKNARIEVAAAGATDRAAAANPAPIGLDLVLASGLAPLHEGDAMELQLLRDGQPLAGQALELRGRDRSQSRWLKTDDAGRVRLAAPAPGRWVLHGVDLRLSAVVPDTWDSRFVNLAFEVQPGR